MHLSKETRQAYLALLACVVLGAVIRWYVHVTPVSVSYTPISFACHVVGLILWWRFLRRRFVRREVLVICSLIVVLLLLLLFTQTFKYEFVLNGTTLSRLLWYAYYVPISFVPTLLFLSTLYMGRRQNDAVDRRWYFLLAVPAILSMLMLTNDFHQLAFRFDNDLAVGVYNESEYSHNVVFYAVWVWSALMAISCLIVTRQTFARAKLGLTTVMPFLVIVLMVCLLPLFGPVTHIPALRTAFEFPDITCILTVAFMEAMVMAGFFPVNEGYGALWQASSLRGGFVDSHCNLVNVAKDAPVVTAAQVEQALEQPVALAGGDDLLVAHRVVGGTAFWVRDLSTVHALRERLEDLGDSLAQERSMLAAENELVHSREALAQRQELVEHVVENTADQLATLEAMLDSMPEDDEEFLAAMHRAAVFAAYIKRCSNITLLGEGGLVDTRELALALGESAECLRSLGVGVELHLDPVGRILADDALRAYAAFEEAVEESLMSLSRVCISISHVNEVLEMRCELTADVPLIVEASALLAGELS